MNEFKNLIRIALNLNETFSSKDRYHELLRIIREAIPYDISALMILQNEELVPIASFGLTSEASEKTYPLKMHPRLEIIFRSAGPILFPPNSELPDPFDGMVALDTHALEHVHACLGCPLIVENKVIGILTADALKPHTFDNISMEFLSALAALAGATLRTSQLLDALEETVKMEGMVAQDLMGQAAVKSGGKLIGTGPKILRLKREIEVVANSDLVVLVTGETGTGKEIVAREIHSNSRRFNKPLIYVNCAALPEAIAESELFGHKKGSFTGAIQDRMGKFEVANHGTIFLDEIGELPLSIQAKLLRVIQEGEIQRVGEDKTKKVDVRVIAATNRDLEEEIKKGTFRADLFHRLNVYPLRTPALKEHLNDIPLLVSAFCDYYQRRLGCKSFRLSNDAIGILKKYDWPGNVRELKNIISRATLHASQEIGIGPVILIEPRHLFLPTTQPTNNLSERPVEIEKQNENVEKLTIQEAVKEFKKNYILRAVKKHNGNWAKAAEELGLHRSNLYQMRDQLKLGKQTF